LRALWLQNRNVIFVCDGELFLQQISKKMKIKFFEMRDYVPMSSS
jgi:hypothetical protein